MDFGNGTSGSTNCVRTCSCTQTSNRCATEWISVTPNQTHTLSYRTVTRCLLFMFIFLLLLFWMLLRCNSIRPSSHCHCHHHHHHHRRQHYYYVEFLSWFNAPCILLLILYLRIYTYLHWRERKKYYLPNKDINECLNGK